MNQIYRYKGFTTYYIDECEWFVARDEAELIVTIALCYTDGQSSAIPNRTSINIEPLTKVQLDSLKFTDENQEVYTMLERMHRLLDLQQEPQFMAAENW